MLAFAFWFKTKKNRTPADVITIHEDLCGNYHYHIAINDYPLCGAKPTMRRKFNLKVWGWVSPHIGERYCKECERLAIEKNIL